MSQGNAGAKRQRQKQARREKIEQEIRQFKAMKRRRAMINLLVLIAVGGTIAYFTLRPEGGSNNASAKGLDCDVKTSPEPSGKPVDPPKSPTDADVKKKYVATVETSEGTVEMELANDKSPCTVNSFVHLAEEGFYDGLAFHRIVKDFAIQGGDPKGDGTGGASYTVQDDPPKDFKYEKGTVAMAKNGADPAGTAGSQFFFVPGDGALTLPTDYAVLGKVVSGEETIAKLNAVETKPSSGGENSTPTRAVSITKVTIKEG